VHDRQYGTTVRVNLTNVGLEGNSNSIGNSISADGSCVAFSSDASNLVTGDTNATRDIFVRDRQAHTTERVSITSAGAQAGSPSLHPSISADGRYVAFISYASNLVAGDTNGAADVFVPDRQTGATERVSVDSSGAQANADCDVNGALDLGRRTLRGVRERRFEPRRRRHERDDGRLRPRSADRDDRSREPHGGRSAGEWRQLRQYFDLVDRSLRGLPELRDEPRRGDTNGSRTSSSAIARAGRRNGSASRPAASRGTAQLHTVGLGRRTARRLHERGLDARRQT
jgi:hypothetical protein